MNKYIKKPVEIEAIKFERDSLSKILKWCNKLHDIRTPRCINGIMEGIVDTLEGQYIIKEGEYLIKGIKGEFYPCKPDIFELTYEKSSN